MMVVMLQLLPVLLMMVVMLQLLLVLLMMLLGELNPVQRLGHRFLSAKLVIRLQQCDSVGNGREQLGIRGCPHCL